MEWDTACRVWAVVGERGKGECREGTGEGWEEGGKKHSGLALALVARKVKPEWEKRGWQALENRELLVFQPQIKV